MPSIIVGYSHFCFVNLNSKDILYSSCKCSVTGLFLALFCKRNCDLGKKNLRPMHVFCCFRDSKTYCGITKLEETNENSIKYLNS